MEEAQRTLCRVLGTEISFDISSRCQAFAKVFQSTPDDLDMHIIYDVSHNIAKVEEHVSFLLETMHDSLLSGVSILQIYLNH
jgi:hypothetical protein